jgi:hypothetical protein
MTTNARILRELNAEIAKGENRNWWRESRLRVHPLRMIPLSTVDEFFAGVAQDPELLRKRQGILAQWARPELGVGDTTCHIFDTPA